MEAFAPLAKRVRRWTNAQASASQTIACARNVSNPFDELNLPRTLPHAKLTNLQLRLCTGSSLADDDSCWMINSIEETLRPLYESSIMKWNRREKLNDMHHRHQRFLIVGHEQLGERIAFLSFRWDVEERVPIMYVYELFVEARARGRHVGQALMRYAEDLCRKQNVRRIVLTVFLDNHAAMRLYRDRLRYVVDDDSPSRHGFDEVGYEILSKQLNAIAQS